MIRVFYLSLCWLAVSLPAWAQDVSVTDNIPDASTGGAVSTALSMQLLCNLTNNMEGNIGLLIGLCLAIYGLWVMVRSGALKWGITLIIAGALFTSLMSLLVSGVQGLSSILVANGVSLFDTSGPLQYAMNFKNSCDSIVIDLSGYDDQNEAISKPGGRASRGIPDIAGNQRSGSIPYSKMPNTYQPMNASCTSRRGSEVGGGKTVLGGDTIILTDCFGYRPGGSSNNSRPRPHKGVDITYRGNSNGDGGQIKPSGDATVKYAGWGNGAGWMATLGSNGNYTQYFHMSSKPNLTAGQAASAGFGRMGNTGCGSCGAHLHFEYIQNGVAQDPCGLIGC
ncbi:MAG TPA: M23 family metallopeptidase [Alphaproteobacteria bacterium]|nr:M23 family metallopeptidase [Alphaproteobacteria bacterium]